LAPANGCGWPSSLTGTNTMVKLTISYGYDIHRIEIDDESFAAIENGHRVELDGQGFVHDEDGMVADHWVFNEEPGEIYFWLDNGTRFNRHDGPWIENA
jgi:hypothetical protein